MVRAATPKKEIKPKKKDDLGLDSAPSGKSVYYESVGRRKTAVARVRMWESKKPSFSINEKPLEHYLQESESQKIANEALEKGATGKIFAVSVLVRGGGSHAQAEAIRQGIARGLEKFDSQLRSSLKTLGFLTRDPRMRERKKFGLKRARRARQWRKR